jgi:hypothetical protein
MQPIYEALKENALATWKAHNLLNDTVHVKARALTPTEAIGNPEADDFPIQKGKERLMQAEIDGAMGQAFTDQYGDYRGTLQEITGMPLTNNYRRAIFTAAVNAGLRKLGVITGTVHCRDDGPRQCAQALCDHIESRYGNVKITQIGFQPRMVESLAARYDLRVLDMDKDNIDSKKYGVVVESPDVTKDAVAWADLLLVTGTTLVNGTLPDFVGDTPVLFYGTTIAGAAHLMGWERFCATSS